MNKAQLKQLRQSGIPDHCPIEESMIVLTCKIKQYETAYRFYMRDSINNIVNQNLFELQDSMLITQIRYRVLGKRFKEMNKLKDGLLSLTVNNFYIFTIPIQWVARTIKGMLINPNILLVGTKNNKLEVDLNHRPGTDIPSDCEIAVALSGYRIRNSSIID
jgi:hypothetical protein